ncbi:MAG TPA: STAS domain-containing protein [Terriglobales bacterium]|nr:STAS domain-containing protein [Terriglobales bacterium]
MDLTFEQRSEGTTTVIRATGRIVLGAEADALDSTVKAALNDVNEVLLNLAGVNYVDSSGLGLLVRMNTAARARKKRIVLCCLTERIQHLFKMTNVTGLFQIFADEASALSLRPPISSSSASS